MIEPASSILAKNIKTNVDLSALKILLLIS